jgi:hypothetical protein
MYRSSTFRSLALIALFFCTTFSQPNTQIQAAKPNHYFFTPTAYMNNEFEVVASMHEVSYTLPLKFQAYGSFVDNVGRLCFGARYGILDNLSVGAGLAWSLISFPRGGHAILHSDPHPRFGTYLCWGFLNFPKIEAALTPHIQAGYHVSVGADYGMMITPVDFWSIIGEFGFSFDISATTPYFNTIWGARVHPPQIPFLSFDFGLDFVERPPEEFARQFWPFFDVVFTMKTM